MAVNFFVYICVAAIVEQAFAFVPIVHLFSLSLNEQMDDYYIGLHTIKNPVGLFPPAKEFYKRMQNQDNRPKQFYPKKLMQGVAYIRFFLISEACLKLFPDLVLRLCQWNFVECL